MNSKGRPTALVGAGTWGRTLLRALCTIPALDVRLVVDPSAVARERAQIVAPTITMVDDIRMALENTNIEAIVIGVFWQRDSDRWNQGGCRSSWVVGKKKREQHKIVVEKHKLAAPQSID